MLIKKIKLVPVEPEQEAGEPVNALTETIDGLADRLFIEIRRRVARNGFNGEAIANKRVEFNDIFMQVEEHRIIRVEGVVDTSKTDPRFDVVNKKEIKQAIIALLKVIYPKSMAKKGFK